MGMRCASSLCIRVFMEKTMQTTPKSNEVFSTPGSEDDQAQPAPPDDSRNLPELPDPTEVGEDG